MSDEDIKKALECCFNDECENCPNRGDKFHCFDKVKEEALALINRQQAVIDDLKRDTVPKLQDSLNRANKYGRQADEENARLKVEIERLNSLHVSLGTDSLGNDADVKLKYIYDLETKLEAIKSEAIKEFSEKVKNYVKTHCNPYGKPIFDYDTSLKILKYLDNLLAEMAGGENA